MQGKTCILVAMKKSIAILGAVSEEIAAIKKAMHISDRTRLAKAESVQVHGEEKILSSSVQVWEGKKQNKRLIRL